MGIRNIAEVQRGHASLFHFTEKLVAESLVAAGVEARQHVFRYPEFKPRTGKLQGATGYKVFHRTSSGRVLKVFNTKGYAEAIDKGAHAHQIVARRTRFLRFVGRDGHFVFRRSVRHPGNRPYKFLYNATDAAFRVGARFMRDGMSRIAKRF